MAKLWNPPNDLVGEAELVGRRLFDEPDLHGVENQPPSSILKLHHFEEKRDAETSLDRLGRSNLEQPVLRYLQPRAEAQGSAYSESRKFSGWALVRVKELKSFRKKALKVLPSPIKTDDPDKSLSNNPYHAHVLRHPDLDNYTMALHLREVYISKGSLQGVPLEPRRSLVDRLVQIPPISAILSLFKNWTKSA